MGRDDDAVAAAVDGAGASQSLGMVRIIGW